MTKTKKFRFRNFKVYQDALLFKKLIRTIINDFFPKDELFSLTSQTLRATNSIILNIAEGANRSTDKDFANFLNKAHTSLDEVVACSDIALIDKYISDKTHGKILIEAEKIANQLTAFRNELLKN